jgi:hypothetical protein
VEPYTTVVIPVDDRVIFIRSFNRAKFSSRLSEVSQPLDSISGIEFLVGGGWVGKRGLFGTVRVRCRTGARQRRLESFS